MDRIRFPFMFPKKELSKIELRILKLKEEGDLDSARRLTFRMRQQKAAQHIDSDRNNGSNSVGRRCQITNKCLTAKVV